MTLSTLEHFLALVMTTFQCHTFRFTSASRLAELSDFSPSLPRARQLAGTGSQSGAGELSLCS